MGVGRAVRADRGARGARDLGDRPGGRRAAPRTGCRPGAGPDARGAAPRPFVSIGAGILVAIPLLSTVFMAQPDNFSLYQPLVIASLWMAARALRGGPTAGRSFVLAGLFAGLATLARNDGLFVLLSLGIVFAWDRWRAWRAARSAGTKTPSATRPPALPLAAA